MKEFCQYNDKQLWNKIVEGNISVLEELYRKHAKGLFLYGKKITQDEGIIYDAIHDVFVHLWDKKDAITVQKSLKYYLYVSFRNDLIKKINHSQKNETLEEHHMQFKFEAYMGTVLEWSKIANPMEGRVFNALNKLPERQREAIYLHFIEELPYENISEIMGVKINYLYNLISIGLKRIKENLQSEKRMNTFLLMMLFLNYLLC